MRRLRIGLFCTLLLALVSSPGRSSTECGGFSESSDDPLEACYYNECRGLQTCSYLTGTFYQLCVIGVEARFLYCTETTP